jgi:hypothetical protein
MEVDSVSLAFKCQVGVLFQLEFNTIDSVRRDFGPLQGHLFLIFTRSFSVVVVSISVCNRFFNTIILGNASCRTSLGPQVDAIIVALVWSVLYISEWL